MRIVVVATLVLMLLPGWWRTAQAQAASVATFADLQDLLANCTTGASDPPTEAQLTADIDAAASNLAVACHATLDLNGHELDVAGVVIQAGQLFTVDDSTEGGKLTADGSAGMEPGIRTTAATLVINGGTVTATGGGGDFATGGAGIGGGGGGDGGAGGTTTINGGTVTATGGVGGGNFGSAERASAAAAAATAAPGARRRSTVAP